MTPTPPGSAMAYRNESGYARFLDPDHYPCQQPPWGELSAVNTATGDVAWRVPLGTHEELESQGLKNTGTPISADRLRRRAGWSSLRRRTTPDFAHLNHAPARNSGRAT